MPPKTGPNRLFFELGVPAGADGEAEIGPLVSLGATRTNSGDGDGDGLLMLDPDGNEFRVRRTR